MDHNNVKGFIIFVYLAAASTILSKPITHITTVATVAPTSSSSPPTVKLTSTAPAITSKPSISTTSVAATTPVTCGSPPGFRDGHISFSNAILHVGSWADFICADGFFISGTTDSNATLTCMANGNWSDTEPSCSPKGRGLNFTLSKSQFIEGAEGNIDLVCSIFNDFMPNFQEIIISRDNKSGSIEFLAKLDSSGNTTLANSSIILQKMHAEGLIGDLKSPKNISIKLSLNESFLSCEDEATYRCRVSYTDTVSKPLYVEAFKNLSGGFFRPKEATLTAKRNGTSIPETTATNPAQVQIGDELEINCTALIGSDTKASIDMKSNIKLSTTLIPETGVNQSSAMKVDNCQYSSTGILKHIVSGTDPENMTFACEATANTPDSYQIVSTNKPQLFIEKYVVCPRPALDHGSVVLSGTSINSTAMLTCDPGYRALYSRSAICLSSGNWNTDLRCVEIECGNMTKPDDGDIIYVNGTGLHAVAKLECGNFSTLNGSGLSVCEQSGSWSNIDSKCVPINIGLSLEFSKNPFVLKSTDNVTITCSVNWQELDNMVNTTYELLIRRQKHTVNIWEQLGKLDNTGQVFYINDSSIFHTMELTEFWNPSTFSNISLSLTVNESYLHCEDATLYECYLSYSDLHANRRYAAISKQLNSASVQSSATLTATLKGSVLPDTNSTHPALIQVGDVLELNCTAEVGSDRSARILWESTTSVSLDTLIVYPPLTKSDVDTFENCQSVRSETIQHVITASDPANMTFACKASFLSANGTTTTNNPRFYLDIYSVCPRPPTPAHGFISLGGTTVNSRAEYSCDNGLSPSSGFGVCLPTGIWDTGFSCKAIECGNLTELSNGTVNYLNGTGFKSVAEIQCDDAYMLNGSGILECQQDGSWSNAYTQCVLKSCPNLSVPEHGFLTLDQGNLLVNETVTFGCYPGYLLVGAENITCQQNMTWTDDVPECAVKNCTKPVAPANGRFIISEYEGLAVNSTATISCRPGYNLTGQSTIHCQENTSWSQSPASCVLIECPYLQNPENGLMNLDIGDRKVNDTATYSCYPGYTLSSNQTSVCTEHGIWSSETPECTVNNCTEPSPPPHGFYNISGMSVNSTAQLVCPKGSSLIGNGTITCMENNTWTNSSSSCVLNECPVPLNPDNGYFKLNTGNRRVYSTITYYCYPGYSTIGPNTTICGESGSWIDEAPKCLLKNCTEPSSPPYGLYDMSEGLSVNSTAQLICVYGSSLEGNGTITCLENNTWTNSSANCVVNECPVPVNPDNGFFNLNTGSRHVNDTVTYNCYLGYSMKGPNTTVCGGSGNWIDEAPKCLLKNCTEPSPPPNGMYDISEGLSVNSTAQLVCANGSLLMGNGTITCLDNKMWTNVSGHCVVNECPVPASLDNGYFKLNTGSRNVNDTVTYYCHTGYSIKGPNTTMCSGGGNWTGGAPICLLKNCSEPTSPKNGNINITEGLSVNSSVTISCNNGYFLNGSHWITCLESASWSSNNFSCNAVDCGAWESKVPTVVSHSKVIYYPDTKFQSVAIATCNEGYRLINTTKNTIAVCGENGTWSIDSPPMCEAVVCPRFNVSESVNVSLTGSEYLPVNTTATFRCKNNKTSIIGARVIRCQASGEWTDKPPTCLKINDGVTRCPREKDSHENTWNETEPGTNVIMECQTNYTGIISRQCTQEGKWLLPIYDCYTQELNNVVQDIAAVLDNPENAVVVVESALDKLKDITSKPEGTQIFSGEIEKVTSVLENIANISEKMNVTDTQTQDFLETTSNLLDSKNTNAWKSVEQKDNTNAQEQDDKGAEKILTVISRYSEAVAKTLNNTKTSKTVAAENLVLHVSKITNDTKDILFPDSEAQQKYNISGSFRLTYQAIKDLTNYSSVVYKNLSGILSSQSVADGKNGTKREISSSVISVKIDNWQKNRDNFSIQLTLEHFTGSKGEPHCSFWNDTESGWDGTGCTLDVSNSNEFVTACNCTHLTNFAILMSPIQDNVKNKAIDIITITACSISLIALVLTVAVHAMLWRYLKSDRVVILVNLSVALIISYLIFLIGVDRTENKAACTAVAVLLQYIYLVVFFLMLAEGIEIGVSVLYVFVTKSRLKWLLPSAWLIPAVIVGISLGATQLKGYGNDQFCWLSVQGGLIWAFIGPACIIIVVNFVLLVLVIKAMFKAKTLADKSRAERTKAGVRCLCILLPLMGCTWLIGIFYVNKSMAWIQYVFAVCNGLQGLVIFICHCAMNKQIRMAIQRRKKKYFDSLMSSRSSSKPFSLPRASTASTSQFEISNSFSGDYESKTSQGRINSRSNRNSFEMMPTSNRDSSEMNASLKRRL